MTGNPAGTHPTPQRAPAPPAAVEQLAQAERSLAAAHHCADPADTYIAVHLAALRAAAAVIAARHPPETTARGRRRIRSVWVMLPEAAPELSDWSALFAASAVRRQRLEAGIRDAVSERDAQELADAATVFLRLVRSMLPAPQELFSTPTPYGAA